MTPRERDDGPRRGPARDVRGFTLVEVLVALSIMSLVMVALYSTLNTTLDTRDMLTRDVKAARLGPQILELFERDLRRAWTFNIEGDMVFKGESRTMLGESADTLVFLTSVDSTLTQRVGDMEVTADICETGYRLRPNPTVPDVLELWRRQSFHIDEDPLEDGTYELVHDRVISLRLRYYADEDVETDELEEWDASEMHELPSMVKIQLGIEVGPRTAGVSRNSDANVSRVLWFERLIPLQRDSALTMRVHPLPPTFADAANAGGPNAAADGEDGGEDIDEGDLGDEFEGGPNGGGLDGGGGGGDAGDLGDLLDDLFGGGGG